MSTNDPDVASHETGTLRQELTTAGSYRESKEAFDNGSAHGDVILASSFTILSASSPLRLELQQHLENLDDMETVRRVALHFLYGLGTPPSPKHAYTLMAPYSHDVRLKAILAQCYLFGQGVEQDVNQGKAFLEAAQQAQDAYAYLVLGDSYRLGQGIADSEDNEVASRYYNLLLIELDDIDAESIMLKSLAHLRLSMLAATEESKLASLRTAAAYSFPPAWYALGKKLLEVSDVQENVDEIVVNLTRAADVGYLDACIEMGRNHGQLNVEASLFATLGFPTALKYYLYAAEQGNHEFRDFVMWHTRTLKRGVGTMDIQSSFEALLRAVDSGDADAQVNLGLCYEFALGCTQKYESAFELYTKAAANRHPFGEFCLGRCYDLGQGVGLDCVKAVSWYAKSAAQGCRDAQHFLAYCYESGDGVENQDLSRSLELHIQAATRGDPRAQDHLGYLYSTGKFVDHDYKQAVYWYQLAAIQGYADAQHNLGYSYFLGNGVEKDLDLAREWYRKAAHHGSTTAQIKIGRLYELGNGLEQDYTQAIHWYSLAAAQGDTLGQVYLGLCYHFGRGVPVDPVKAAALYMEAARQDCVEAQLKLAYCYEHGVGVHQSFEDAVTWYTIAAEANCSAAQYALGFCYERARGVDQNYFEAVHWYLKAVKHQANPFAETQLGLCYEFGLGVEEDLEKAFNWYRTAALRGHPTAQYHLGLCYELGRGVETNYMMAMEWYVKAAENGYELAEQKLAEPEFVAMLPEIQR